MSAFYDSKQKEWNIQTNWNIYFFVQDIVSNSQHIVFYSEQRQITVNGNAINWNSTGYWEEDFQILSKFRVKCSEKGSKYHMYSGTNNHYISYYINTTFFEENEPYWKCQWKITPISIQILKHESIFQIVSFYDNLISDQTLIMVLIGPHQNWSWVLWRGWKLCLCSTAFVII